MINLKQLKNIYIQAMGLAREIISINYEIINNTTLTKSTLY